MPDYKIALQKKHISISSIAKRLGIDKGAVSKILNNKYPGNEETKKKVIRYIQFLLIDKKDLNPVMYENSDLFIRALSHSIRSMKVFSDDEAHLMLDVVLTLKIYNKERV
jgi:transcriptional regulator with XRE-family HTH domain